MKLFAIGLLLFVAQFAAAGTKACYCEIGNYPQNQQKAFSLGCGMWLKSQKDCAVKEKVHQGTDYTAMSFPSGTTEVSIGYVGHWSDTLELVDYVTYTIAPMMKQKDVSVSVDNTACRAMVLPFQIEDYIKTLKLQPKQTLKIRGNQVNSIGKWDSIVGSKYNFYASVSSLSKSISYPTCKEFQGYNCLGNVQMNEVGTCTTPSGQISTLRCCKGSGSSPSWQTESECAPN